MDKCREAFEAFYVSVHPITPTKETAWLAWQASREQDAKLKAAEKCAEALRTALDCDQCHFVARAALEEWDKCS